jgi:hypothetical protein
MATYLYCVLSPPRTEALPAGLTGVAQAPVRTLVLSDVVPLEAWIATVDDAALRIKGAALARQALLHNDVVNAALATARTPVPARFGSCFGSDVACVDYLKSYKRGLGALLERVAGAVETSVLVVPSERAAVEAPLPSRTESGAGHRYLQTLRERARIGAARLALLEEQGERIASAVERLVRSEVRSVDSRGTLSITHLVSRDALDSYRATLASLPHANGVRLVRGAVRAPYSFAELRMAGTGHDSGSLSSDE